MVDFNKALKKNKDMAKDIPTENTQTALALADSKELGTPDNFDLAFAELSAELEESLQALGVQNIVAPSDLLPDAECNSVSKRYNLTDAFPFEITQNGEPKLIAIFVMNEVNTNEVITVGQGLNTQRAKILVPFQKVRVMGGKLTLTNMRFQRLDKGKKAGNYPIILQTTADTKHIVTAK